MASDEVTLPPSEDSGTVRITIMDPVVQTSNELPNLVLEAKAAMAAKEEADNESAAFVSEKTTIKANWMALLWHPVVVITFLSNLKGVLVFKNWKTTLAAVVSLLPQALAILNIIDPHLANQITVVATAIGLIHAADSGQTTTGN